MGRSWPRCVTFLLLLLSAVPAFGQKDPPDPSLYRAFFEFLRPPPAAAEAEVTAKAESVLGLTQEELKSLYTLASEYRNRQAPVFREIRGVTFEARLDMIAEGKVSDRVADRLARFEHQQNELILEIAGRVRALVGEVRFQALDEYLRKEAGSNFASLAEERPRVLLNGEPKP